MRKTYAHNSIILGVLLGIIVGAKFGTVLGVIAAIVVSVAGWFLIRMLENAIDKGVDAAGKAIKGAVDRRRENQ